MKYAVHTLWALIVLVIVAILAIAIAPEKTIIRTTDAGKVKCIVKMLEQTKLPDKSVRINKVWMVCEGSSFIVNLFGPQVTPWQDYTTVRIEIDIDDIFSCHLLKKDVFGRVPALVVLRFEYKDCKPTKQT